MVGDVVDAVGDDNFRVFRGEDARGKTGVRKVLTPLELSGESDVGLVGVVIGQANQFFFFEEEHPWTHLVQAAGEGLRGPNKSSANEKKSGQTPRKSAPFESDLETDPEGVRREQNPGIDGINLSVRLEPGPSAPDPVLWLGGIQRNQEIAFVGRARQEPPKGEKGDEGPESEKECEPRRSSANRLDGGARIESHKRLVTPFNLSGAVWPARCDERGIGWAGRRKRWCAREDGRWAIEGLFRFGR